MWSFCKFKKNWLQTWSLGFDISSFMPIFTLSDSYSGLVKLGQIKRGIYLGQHFFLTQMFLDTSVFGPKCFETNNRLDPHFFRPKIFWIKNCWTQMLLLTQNLLSLYIFGPKIFFNPYICDQKFYLARKLFGPEIFLDKNFFGTNLFRRQKIFLAA